MCRMTVELHDHLGSFRDWAQASALVLMSWIERRELHVSGPEQRAAHLSQAERLCWKALSVVKGKGQYRVLGDVYNNLGLTRTIQEQYAEALDFFCRALEYWVLIGYYYGIQAVYFNIAEIYARWGESLEAHKHKHEAHARYRLAIIWLDKSIRLSEKTGIGYDFCQSEIRLADLHLRLGNQAMAKRMAATARKMADDSGNKTDIAQAFGVAARVHLAAGEYDTAVALVDECRQKIGGTKFMRLLERELKGLLSDASLTTDRPC